MPPNLTPPPFLPSSIPLLLPSLLFPPFSSLLFPFASLPFSFSPSPFHIAMEPVVQDKAPPSKQTVFPEASPSTPAAGAGVSSATPSTPAAGAGDSSAQTSIRIRVPGNEICICPQEVVGWEHRRRTSWKAEF